MKYIPLTQGKQALVDDDDYDWLSQWKWYYHKALDKKGGYAARGVRSIKLAKGYQNIFMHRLVNKTPAGYETDHINRNTLDNRRSNLRTVTRAENRYNTPLRIDNKSGYRGVSWYKSSKKWVVHISLGKQKVKTIGYFTGLEEAVQARKAAEKELLGAPLPAES